MKLGPLILLGINKGLKGQAEVPYVNGWPNEMPIVSERPLDAVVRIGGMLCSDRSPLHLWYREGPPFQFRGMVRMDSRTDEYAELGPGSGRDVIDLRSVTTVPTQPMRGWNGYMLFNRQGNWKLTVEEGGREVGAVVIRAARSGL